MSKKPTVLLIMDGFGLAPAGPENAISCAKTPNLDKLFAECPNTQLQASGLDVGLPAGQMGNSEVGHTNIGAGRVVYQDLPRISNAVEDGSFFENAAYKSAMDECVRTGARLHLMGLLSDGGVHSHINHLFALLEMAKRRGVKEVYVHALLDGRDVAPTSGAGYVKALVEKCAELGTGKIATIQGRFYGMDRDKRWDRVEKGYRAVVCGEGVQDGDPVHAVETVDTCVGQIVEAVKKMGGVVLITADHGNADRIMKPDGSPDTAHTTNPVPLIVSGADVKLRPGRLCDLCPTMLDLMGLSKPAQMTGESLIVK